MSSLDAEGQGAVGSGDEGNLVPSIAASQRLPLGLRKANTSGLNIECNKPNVLSRLPS